MTPFSQRIMTAMNAQRDVLGLLAGKPLPIEERDKVLDSMVALFIAEEKKKWEKARVERKKASLDERAEGIFKLHPNRQGGVAALKAISDAIAKDGYEFVLERTTMFANACARYNRDDKAKIPHASTWYHQRRHALDDPKTWFKGGGKPKDEQHTSRSIPAPDGWILWATNRRDEWGKENEGYDAPGGGAISERNFFMLPESWQAECRQQLSPKQQTA